LSGENLRNHKKTVDIFSLHRIASTYAIKTKPVAAPTFFSFSPFSAVPDFSLSLSPDYSFSFPDLLFTFSIASLPLCHCTLSPPSHSPPSPSLSIVPFISIDQNRSSPRQKKTEPAIPPKPTPTGSSPLCPDLSSFPLLPQTIDSSFIYPDSLHHQPWQRHSSNTSRTIALPL